MKKSDDFFAKYEMVLWQIIAAVWFFIEYFCHKEIYSLLRAGVFWVVIAIFEIVRINRKKKQN